MIHMVTGGYVLKTGQQDLDQSGGYGSEGKSQFHTKNCGPFLTTHFSYNIFTLPSSGINIWVTITWVNNYLRLLVHAAVDMGT